MKESDKFLVKQSGRVSRGATGLLREFLKREWGWLTLSTIILAAFAIMRTYSTSYISVIVRQLQTRQPIGSVMILAFTGAALACSSYLMRYAGSAVSIWLTEKLALQTRCRIVEHLCRIPWITYEKLQTGQLQSVIRKDVQEGADLIYSVFSRIELNILLFAATFVYMAVISPALATVIAIFILIMAYVNQKILKRQKIYKKISRDAAGEVSETVLSACKGMSTIKAYTAGDFILSLLKANKKKYNDYVYRSEAVDTGRLSIYNLTSSLTLYTAVLVLGYNGIKGNVNWGDMLVFILLVRQMIMPAEVIFRWMARVSESVAAWERVYDVLRIPIETNTAEELPEPMETIRIEEVDFSYGQGTDILHNQSIELRRGEITGLMGRSGSGKTTLSKILCSLYPAWDTNSFIEQPNAAASDTIHKESQKQTDHYQLKLRWILDGKLWNTGNAGGWCTYNPTEAQLFNTSIYENIVFDNAKVTRKKCMELADELGGGEFLRTLPEGIDTVIENGGKALSGGQRQMIMNLRALLSGQKMIIMDEAFSALDVDKCNRLMNHLLKHQPDRFILLVTHQKWLLSKCKNIIELS